MTTALYIYSWLAMVLNQADQATVKQHKYVDWKEVKHTSSLFDKSAFLHYRRPFFLTLQ